MDSDEFVELPQNRFLRIDSIDAWVFFPSEGGDTGGEGIEVDGGDPDELRSYIDQGDLDESAFIPAETQVYINGQGDPFKFTGEDDALMAITVLHRIFKISPLDVE